VPPAAELEYAYDASDARVRKTVVGAAGSRHSLYVFGPLELRLAAYDSVTQRYDVSAATEVPYLFAHGVRLARVVHTAAPDFTAPSARVFLELGDHLGTTAVVLDRATGELVERTTAYAYGAVESDLRPGRWDEFREEHRFTGKEDDVEVGLIYFGARYLNPLLGRWISADPLAVHAPGRGDLNLYAYVHGRVLVAVDPVGLEEANVKQDYQAAQQQYQQSRSELQVAADQAFAAFQQASDRQGQALARGQPTDPMATSNALAAYVEITHKIERVDREWQRLDAAYQALVSPVSVAVQGSPERAVREIRQHQLADFNTAANAIKSSLAAPVSMLAYTVVQEARNGKLDADDYRNLQRIGVAVSGAGAVVLAAGGRLRDAKGRFVSDPSRPRSPHEFTDAQRRAAWKKLATDPSSGLSEAERTQIVERGYRGPRRVNEYGEIETMELSHERVPLREGGTEVVPRWPADHATVDPYRQLKRR
jgi:RHS repeat-associated protein